MADGMNTATVKYGKDFNEPWFVASGSNEKIRKDLCEFAGLPEDEMGGLTLMELIAHVSQLAQGRSALRSQLGAKLEPIKKPENAPQKAAKPTTRKSTKAKATKPAEGNVEAPETTPDGLLAQIEATTTLDELKAVLKEHNDEIRKDSQLKEAVKKRNASFKA